MRSVQDSEILLEQCTWIGEFYKHLNMANLFETPSRPERARVSPVGCPAAPQKAFHRRTETTLAACTPSRA